MTNDEAREWARRVTDYFMRQAVIDPPRRRGESDYTWALGALEAYLAWVLVDPQAAIEDLNRRLAAEWVDA